MKRTSVSDFSGQTFDLVIIGGGITGACAAREAALRGLSVALFEKNDFASGTSSRSTKLLHGGLRYLQSYEFKLVREACRERELMLHLAPHLSHPRPFIYVLYEGYPESMFLLNAGLTIYDLFSGNPLKRRHRMLNARRLLEIEPYLNPSGLKGGGLYYDFLTDDARFTLDTVKGACEAGALAANYMRVSGFIYEGGRIRGVQVTDDLSGESGEVRARQVINTAGVWVDEVRFMEQGVRERMLRPSKGVHITLRKSDFPLQHAVFVRSPRDRRVVWPIPALDEDLVYIGTTDTDYDGSLDHVVATDDDIDYLLEVANFTIPGRRIGREHIVATWAGLRPLVRPEGEMAASAVSREHQIFLSPSGLLNIAGGKLTTARVMGKQVVQRAVELLQENYGLPAPRPSSSHRVPISGGSRQAIESARQALAGLEVPEPVRRRWLDVYGGNAAVLAGIAEKEPDAAVPFQPAAGGSEHCSFPLTPAEVRYAVQEEMALTLTDFFARRASVFYWTEDGGLGIARQIAVVMGELLGWSADEQERQIEAYRRWVEANRVKPVPAV
ncbi:MAG: glycerol-3-phosphate dehydrogenase/oxidase [Chloroflexi bacterium]|jgi:glycerol-3-phosphate dehydrogenase|nr:glycerol-3-phosphate dehydrogenase/oxidase [Chloroflexota bacterium]